MAPTGRRLRALWRVLWQSERLEAEMQEEMRLHIDLEAERLVREHGLDPAEALRRAHVAFGGVEKYKEEARDARGRQWLDALGSDARLGLRMLLKHRGLTLVGGFAMAVAIAIGAAAFEVLRELLDPTLPLQHGERVVSLQYATENAGRAERRVLREFSEWRHQIRSVEHVGAFRTVQHNLVTPHTPPEPIKVAEMTAAGFIIAATPPVLGRYLVASDESESAAPVLVIGHQVWRSRFGSDPHVVGRTITLGGVPHTVVGVMPESFKFPVDHQFWKALRLNPLEHERLRGPSLYLFGRLAPGVSAEQAEAELSTINGRLATQYPETHAHLRLIALPYTREHLDLSQPALVWALQIVQLLVGALCLVVAVNLAILMYARTVTRLGEIAVRAALGATRRRILAQLFIEALALTTLGAMAGLLLADIGLERVQALARLNGGVPFWIGFELSAATGLYALGLAVVSALLMGVLPGLKATGAGMAASLPELNGRAGTRLGPVWTSLVVAQVAIAVAILPAAVYVSWQVVRLELSGPGFAAERFVVGILAADDAAVEREPERVALEQAQIISRLGSEPGVGAVTFTSNVPGFASEVELHIERDPTEGREDSTTTVANRASRIFVSPDAFGVYGVEIVARRAFTPADAGRANHVIVNRTFAERYLPNRAPLGTRFRYAAAEDAAPGPQVWYQIVGVVRDFPAFPPSLSVELEPVVYHPARLGEINPVVMAVRLDGGLPEGFVTRFRQVAAEVNPAFQLRRVVPLATYYNDLRSLWRYIAWGAALLSASVLLLSAAGIYALMSFTVAQRTREIGIRMALGAAPYKLFLAVFGRVARQIAIGLIAGSALSGLAFLALGLSVAQATTVWSVVATVMAVVAFIAASGPARRGLRVQVTEALRLDA